MKKILFIVAHRPGRSPGQRFRFEQYLEYLSISGIQYDISYLLNEKDDKYFYSKGHYFRKFIILLKTIFIRLKDLKRADNYDVIFIYREAVMFGSTWFEKRFKNKKPRVILDYDDAIWLMDVSAGNKNLKWLKRPSKTSKIISYSDLIITGNEYLANYARTYNKNVTVVPTTIDTNIFTTKKELPDKNKICIGWTGSSTTLRHLELAAPFLKKLNGLYGKSIYLRVIADQPWENNCITTEFIKWNKETEVEDLSLIDIGIMPLPDDKWAKGKCGFKGLQYMALGIPAVMSPVGVNTEIITDGINGFLASSENEWVNKISLLINNPEIWINIGFQGKQTIEEQYSFNAWKDKYLQLF